MAFEAQLPSWSITLTDASGTSGRTRGTFKPGHDTDTYLAALESLAALIEAISGCVAVRCAVSYRVKDSEPATPRRTDPIATLAQYAFTVPDTATFAVIETPATIEQTITDGCFAGQVIDTSRSEVADFIAAVEDGLFCDPFGVDLGPFCSAHIATGE